MNKKTGIIAIIIALLFGGGYGATQLGGTSFTTKSCAVSTVTAAIVGNEASSAVLSAYSNRAWAKIELVETTSGVATNTPSISFDEGTDATLAGGLKLSTSTPSIVFGLNTDFPYTGAVTGITDVGSTTIRVTECRY